VRDQLWLKTLKIRDGAALQIWSDHREPQGYKYRSAGFPSRIMVDMEGVALVLRPDRISKNIKTQRRRRAKKEKETE
jgi:hypothetical protein